MSYAPSVLVQVPLRTGLDEGVEPADAPVGTLSRLDNGVWNKIGRIEKRDGTQTLGFSNPFTMIDGSAAPTAVKKILPARTDITITDGVSLFSKSATGWRTAGRIPELEAKWDNLVASSNPIVDYDVDANSNYVAVTWTASSKLYAAIYGIDGSLVVPPQLVDTASKARVFLDPLGTPTATIFYGLGGGITARTLSPTSLSATTSIVSGISGWDACRNTKASGFVVASIEAGPVVKVRLVSTALAVTATATSLSANADMVTLCSTPELVYVGATDTTNLRLYMIGHNPTTLGLVAGPTIVRTYGSGDFIQSATIARRDATSCVIAWTENAGPHTWSLAVTSGGAVVANSERRSFYTRLASKAFSLNSRDYVGLYTTRPPVLVGGAAVRQINFFLVEIETSSNSGQTSTPHRLAAMIAPRESSYIGSILSAAPVVGSVAYLLGPVAGEPGIQLIQSTNGLRLVTINSAPTDPCPTDNLEDLHVIGGGYLAACKASRPFETSFIQPPRVVGTPTVATGGSMAAGTYQYSFVYEWIGTDGLLYRSGPSQPVSVVCSSGSSKVTFSLECTGQTGKANLDTTFTNNPAQVRIVPYRTVAGGTTFYRMSYGSDATGYSVVVNDPLSATVSFVDDKADSAFDAPSGATPLNTRPILYTTGGVLDDVMPPAFYAITVHRGRVWGVAGDGRTIWFSKKSTDDPTIFPGFNEVLRAVVRDRVVALRSLDDKLVIFTDRALYVLFGDGPAATGQGSDFTEPTLVHGNMPCVTARSIVSFPGGIAFQAPRGIYLLSRELELTWIGRPVQDEVAAIEGGKILSATHVQTKSLLRFSLGAQEIDGDGENFKGVVAAYDYSIGAWSRFLYPGTPVSEVVVNDIVYSAVSTTIVAESPTTHLDNGTWVPLDFELTLTPSGPVAWQHLRRVQLLGAKQTDHDLRVRFAFEHRDTYSQDIPFDSVQVATNKDCPTIRVGSQNGANPKAKAIRVRVNDAAPSGLGAVVGAGKGPTFSALGLEFVPKPGLPRHGANNSKV